MSLSNDLRILYHLVAAPRGGATPAEWLELYYRGQADLYDGFRERLLPGRREWIARLPAGGTWIDFGAGTGSNAEAFGARLECFESIYLVDLCPSLLRIASERVRRHGWRRVEIVETDAARFVPPAGKATLVTFSYSLSMMPEWRQALDHAIDCLAEGGVLGSVDFYVSSENPPPERARHSAWTRWFWPAWFAWDHVVLSPDRLAYLEKKLEPVWLEEARARVPYLPWAKVPYYSFIGRK